ncbi:MAG TPA: hypothetical protein VGD07_16965 [Methylomirabilota bacterium]
MRLTRVLVMAGLGLLVALPAAAQQVEIEARPPTERPARVVPPPLHYETTRPPDNDFYPQGTRVEHDPAFIEPLAGSYETPSGSGRFGLSGWTAPNPPVGSPVGGWRDVSGWFAIGFSVTWDGPPARKARPR